MKEEISFDCSDLQVQIRNSSAGEGWDRLYQHIRYAFRSSPHSQFWIDAHQRAIIRDNQIYRNRKKNA